MSKENDAQDAEIKALKDQLKGKDETIQHLQNRLVNAGKQSGSRGVNGNQDNNAGVNHNDVASNDTTGANNNKDNKLGANDNAIGANDNKNNDIGVNGNTGIKAKLGNLFGFGGHNHHYTHSERQRIKNRRQIWAHEVNVYVNKYGDTPMEVIKEYATRLDYQKDATAHWQSAATSWKGSARVYHAKYSDLKSDVNDKVTAATAKRELADKNRDDPQISNLKAQLASSQTREKDFAQARMNHQINDGLTRDPENGLQWKRPNDPLAGKGDQLGGPSGLQNQHGQKINFTTNNRGQIIKRGSAADESPDSGQQKDSGKSKDDGKQLGD